MIFWVLKDTSHKNLTNKTNTQTRKSSKQTAKGKKKREGDGRGGLSNAGYLDGI